MKPKTLHALAEMAWKNGQGASDILREFAIYEQALAKASDYRREMEGWQRTADKREVERAEAERKLLYARAVLGDGWHTLRCGGAVFIHNGVPDRLRDGGDHSEERWAATLQEARALGWEWLDYAAHDGDSPWTVDGEAAIEHDIAIPF